VGNTLRWLVPLLAVMALCAATTTPAAADTVPLPSGAAVGSSSSYSLSSTACPAAGDCVAVGYYADSSGDQQGLIETESAGVWTATEVNASQLSSVAANPDLSLVSVACASAGNCVATGYYTDASTNQQGLIETESGGTWTAATIQLTNLPSVSATPSVNMSSVACPDAQDCVAVGTYSDASGDQQALIYSQSGGAWTANGADLGALETDSDPDASLSQVSCAAAGNCVAVGSYQDAAGSSEGLIDTESNGTWVADQADLSHLVGVDGMAPGAELVGVSCPTQGACAAVGSYNDASGDQLAMVLSETGSVWAPATELQAPANFDDTALGSRYAAPTAISCASAGNCTVVAVYNLPGATEGFELTATGGSWGSGQQTALPADAGTNPELWLRSVACVSAGHCVAVGNYEDSAGEDETLIAAQSGGNWTTASSPLEASYDDNNFDRSGVACTAAGYCVVAGHVRDSSTGNDTAFVLAAPAVAGAPSASVSGTQATVSWSAPIDNGGLPLTGYTVTASDLSASARGGQSVTTTASTLSAAFSGLAPGDSYTFTVSATNPLGSGIAATSASVEVPMAQTSTPPAPAPAPASSIRKELLASLSRLLAPTGAPSRLEHLRTMHGYTFSYRPLESGTVSVRWYELTGTGKHRKRHLAGSGTARTRGTTTVNVRVKLNALGRRLVKSSRRLRLTAVVTFVSGRLSVTRTHAFVLH
jgi:Fibronectin type III domain